MKKLRAIAGYVLGRMMFVVQLPTIMWLVSGLPDMAVHIDAVGYTFTTSFVITDKCMARFLSA